MDIKSVNCSSKEKNRELHSVVSMQVFLVRTLDGCIADSMLCSQLMEYPTKRHEGP